MDPQQRYCVECAARRGNGANPASRYFAAISRKSKRPLAVPKKERATAGGRAAAVGFFALLPIAVALGVAVGRGGASDNGDSEALLQALRNSENGPTSAAAAAGPTATTAGAGAKKKDAKAGKAAQKGEGKVIAHTKNGDVHEVTNFKASKAKEEEDTRIVEENPEQVGDDYVKAQQNLPDVVVVGGDGSSAPSSEGAAEP